MPTKYLDEEGLSHVIRRAKETFADKKELWNWQKTEKAGAVAFEPVPDSVLEPVVEFKFKETLPAEGERGLDNPSTIESVSSVKVTRCGKNLIKLPFFFNGTSYEHNGVTFTLDQVAGTITANGTASDDARVYFVAASSDIKLVAGKTYFLSGCPANGSVSTYYIGGSRYTLADEYLSGLASDIGSGAVWSTDVDCNFVSSVVIKSGTTVTSLVFKPMLEEAASATAFEQYEGADYIVNLGNTFYGGTVNLTTGVMTVTHQGVVLTGQEIWGSQEYNNYLRCGTYIPFFSVGLSSSYCTHYSIGYGPNKIYANNTSHNRQLFIGTNGTLAELKAFLAEQYDAGTPVVYVSEVPAFEYQTVQLTSTQILSLAQTDKYNPRINTVYTDAESVQVGYQKFTAEGNFVHKTGAEDVEGFKVFSNAHTTDPNTSPNVTVSSLAVKHADLVKGTLPVDKKLVNVQMLDSSGSDINHFGRLGSIEYESPKATDASTRVYMRCWKFLPGDDPHVKDGVAVTVGYDSNGNEYASAPAISDERTNATDIVTRGWSISKSRIDELSL